MAPIHMTRSLSVRFDHSWAMKTTPAATTSAAPAYPAISPNFDLSPLPGSAPEAARTSIACWRCDSCTIPADTNWSMIRLVLSPMDLTSKTMLAP